MSDREAAKALGDVADVLGRLEVAIDAAGPNYRYDPVVKLASKTVSYTGVDCRPQARLHALTVRAGSRAALRAVEARIL